MSLPDHTLTTEQILTVAPWLGEMKAALENQGCTVTISAHLKSEDDIGLDINIDGDNPALLEQMRIYWNKAADSTPGLQVIDVQPKSTA